jgi:hypothetical protein
MLGSTASAQVADILSSCTARETDSGEGVSAAVLFIAALTKHATWFRSVVSAQLIYLHFVCVPVWFARIGFIGAMLSRI